MRANNFYALRLLAAFAVLFGHGYAVAGAACEPLIECSLGYTNVSRIAVDIFFVVSGYLVTESWVRDPNPRRFLARRALRILPALCVAVVATALILGPIVTTLPLASYFREPGTWAYLWWSALRSGPPALPGVFSMNAIPFANASLWTLPMESSFYLMVAAIGCFGFVTRTGATLALFVALAGCLWLGDRYSESAAYFAAGACAYAFRGSVRFSALGGLMVVGFAILTTGELQRWIILMGLPYGALAFALTPGWPLDRLDRFGDLSYGLYLYAFPVQQVVELYLHPSISVGIAGAFSITMLLAGLSWWLVESRMLRLKPRGRPADLQAYCPPVATVSAVLPGK
jgi:peptidoglycan/LPS O-acetylase OafA/YrhL